MAPVRRGKAKGAAIVGQVADSTEAPANDVAQTNGKGVPAKLTKKMKPAKNAKPANNLMQTNGEAAAAAVAAATAAVAALKPETKSTKKVASKKNATQNEQNGDQMDNGDAKPANVQAKSKRAATKKNAKQTEQNTNGDSNEANDEVTNGVPEKNDRRAGKSKVKKEEPAKATEKKVGKGKLTKSEANDPEEDVKNEPEPSKPNKKGAKVKSRKHDVEVDVVPPSPAKGRGKRGAKNVEVAEKPIKVEKPTKGKNKNPAPAKPTSRVGKSKKQQPQEPKEEPSNEASSTETEEEEEEIPAKGRKRQQKVKEESSPAKKMKKDAAVAEKAKSSPMKRKADNKAGPADSMTDETNDTLVTKRAKTSKTEAAADAPARKNPTDTDFSQINFDHEKDFKMKIVSWNVAGLRALVNKNGFEYFEHEKPDIICLQEIKCLEDQVPDQAKLKGFHPYWCSTPGGRGGVAILSKVMPYNVEKNLNDEEMDEEGRIITAEYSKFYLICVYVPNAGKKLINLDRRLRWNQLFRDHVNKLKQKKPVIICGDMNVAHEEIDLANPKNNKKNAGFSNEEREGMTDFLELGFIDTFRDLYPDKEKAYTFWTNMGGARQKNVGWRLDYSIVSENLKDKVVDSFMRPTVLGSDHCPIVLLLNI